MLRRSFLSAALLLPLGGCLHRTKQNHVFGAFLASALKDADALPASIVVLSETDSTLLEQSGIRKTDEIVALMPGVERLVASEFLQLRDEVVSVRVEPAVEQARVVVSYATVREISQVFDQLKSGGWPEIRRRYRNASSIISFSNAGFSADGMQAVFACSVSCGSLCGAVDLLLMEQAGGRWKTKTSSRLWVS